MTEPPQRSSGEAIEASPSQSQQLSEREARSEVPAATSPQPRARVLQRRPFKGRNRTTILELLKQLQNGRCFYAFDCCTKELTVIAHKNHNPFDDDPANLAASCEPCNKRISNLARRTAERTVGTGVCVREFAEGVMARMPGDRTASEQKHEVAWPKFVDCAKELLTVTDEFPYEDFVRIAAKESNVSIYTAENRYVRREDCTRGFLRVFRKGRGGPKIIMLNREIVEEDYTP